jgi:TPR repeat protein
MKIFLNVLGIALFFSSTYSSALPSYQVEACEESQCVENFKKMKKYARHHIPMATEALANFYMHGYGVEQDYVRALRLYERTAKHGSATAQYKTGIMYILGIGKKNLDRGVNWLEWAVKNEHYQSAYTLGLMYYHGENLPLNRKKAIKWLDIAAKNGHEQAQFTLGQLYETGTIVKKNLNKAIELYEKSSSKLDDSKSRLIALNQAIPEVKSDDMERIEVNPIPFQEMIDMKAEGMRNIALAGYGKSPGFSCRHSTRNCSDVVTVDDFSIQQLYYLNSWGGQKR